MELFDTQNSCIEYNNLKIQKKICKFKNKNCKIVKRACLNARSIILIEVNKND
jgi:hypothetical protein